MENEKFNSSPYDRLVGLPPEYRTPEMEDKLEKLFIESVGELGAKNIPELEEEKTEEELYIIKLAESSVLGIMKEYFREKDIPVSLERIHILKKGGTEKYTHGRFIRGAHASRYNSILVDREGSLVDFANTVFHELFHLKSYIAHQVVLEESINKYDLKSYRSGFEVVSRDGKEKYFKDLEESVIGLMTLRFFENVIKNHELFKDELEKREKNGTALEIGRYQEMEKMNDLIDDLWEKNKNSLSREEIEKMFINAQVNGKLLPIGRLIDQTYGKGAFREIGKTSIWDSE